jgi:hypothetical protein
VAPSLFTLVLVFLTVNETSAFFLLAVIVLCTSAAYYALCAEDNNCKLWVYGWKKRTAKGFRPSA